MRWSTTGSETTSRTRRSADQSFWSALWRVWGRGGVSGLNHQFSTLTRNVQVSIGVICNDWAQAPEPRGKRNPMSQQHPHDPHQGQPQGEPGHGSNLPDEAPAGRHAAPPQGQPHGAAPEGQQAYGSQSQQAYGSQGRHAYGSQGAQWGQQPQGVHQPSSQPGLNQAPAAQQPGFGQSHAAPSQPRRSAPGQAPQAGYGQQAQGGQQTQGGHQAYGNQHAQGGWQQPNPQQQGFAPQAHPQHSPHHPQPVLRRASSALRHPSGHSTLTRPTSRSRPTPSPASSRSTRRPVSLPLTR